MPMPNSRRVHFEQLAYRAGCIADERPTTAGFSTLAILGPGESSGRACESRPDIVKRPMNPSSMRLAKAAYWSHMALRSTVDNGADASALRMVLDA